MRLIFNDFRNRNQKIARANSIEKQSVESGDAKTNGSRQIQACRKGKAGLSDLGVGRGTIAPHPTHCVLNGVFRGHFLGIKILQ